MDSTSRFTVLIERRAALRWALASLVLATAAVIGARPAHARVEAPNAHPKVARDLADEINSPRLQSRRWSRIDRHGRRQVQLIVIGTGDDPDFTALRAQVLRWGGSVHARHPLVRGLTIQIPADRVDALAQRADVKSVSPNRPVRLTSSTLEAAAGALGSNGRSYAGGSYSGLDGSGVGIAVLDSGVMKTHKSFQNAAGTSRVLRNVDLRNANLSDWLVGVDSSISPAPGSAALASYENLIANDSNTFQDAYGHGTHVASVAAGRGFYQAPDSTGIAPGANLYDVKVLDGTGNGTLSDVLEGLQWVIFHAKELNIRVLNLSLASSSTESWQTDPLCVAVRRASAAGLTVVVAAGNFGVAANGAEIYGTIGSPGIDPTVITVGAVNFKGTAARGDDTVNNFSSRGPTRGGMLVNGVRVADNLLKPDLVAPGNKVIGAAATRASVLNPTWNALAVANPDLVSAVGLLSPLFGQTLMTLSGTSIAAPAVAGTVALMLQANPGLTPPLIKAILQYSAQPVPGANLLEQGAGMLNVDGAISLAKALRTDIASAIDAGTLSPGASMLASGKGVPSPNSVLNGQSASWSRIVYVGGNRIVSGDALFTRYQPLWDPKVSWAGPVARRLTPVYWSGSGIAANTYVKSFNDSVLGNQALITPAVLNAGVLLSPSSLAGRTGVFTPSATLAAWLASGSGSAFASGIVMSEGVVMSEGIVMSEGVVMSEGIVMSEGVVMSESVVMSETGGDSAEYDTSGALYGEP